MVVVVGGGGGCVVEVVVVVEGSKTGTLASAVVKSLLRVSGSGLVEEGEGAKETVESRRLAMRTLMKDMADDDSMQTGTIATVL